MPSSSATLNQRSQIRLVLGTLVIFCSALALAQLAQQPSTATLVGTVRGVAGEPIAGATVSFIYKDQEGALGARTDGSGHFAFKSVRATAYTLKVVKTGFRELTKNALSIAGGEEQYVELVLEAEARSTSPPSSPSSLSPIQLEDKPNFAIAGITDWTAAGGHGSDTNLRTSEELARETRALKVAGPAPATGLGEHETSESERELRAAAERMPGSFQANRRLGHFYIRSEKYRDAVPLLEAASRIDPADHDNAYDLALAYKATGELAQAREQVQRMLAISDNADARRLLGDIDEHIDDSLGAVQEYERAVRLDPSEQNYFAWGTELLLHRAVPPAIEVLTKGSAANPKSERMLAALGAALYASGAYQQAAQRVCEASDLQPGDPAPYTFLGEMEMASPAPLGCVEQKLAWLMKEQPGDARAKYYYAMSLAKRGRGAESPATLSREQALLEQAVVIDPALSEAHLQLGIVHSEQGKVRDAMNCYREAIATNPQLGEAHFRLARAYQQLGQGAKGQQEIQLYQQIQKSEAEEVERQRRQVRQFVIVLKDQPAKDQPAKDQRANDQPAAPR